jgi:hypothetical protein
MTSRSRVIGVSGMTGMGGRLPADRRRVAGAIGSFLWLVAAGCGPGRPPLVPVTGQVLMEGKPVAGASVMFVGDGRPATGVTDAGGRFVLGTWTNGDGVLAGEYVVCVTQQTVAGPGDSDYAVPNNLLPPVYGAVDTTPLRARVERGTTNDVRLELSP